MAIIFCFTALLFVGLRLYSRIYLIKSFGWDDSFMLVALVGDYAYFVDVWTDGFWLGWKYHSHGSDTERLSRRDREAC